MEKSEIDSLSYYIVQALANSITLFNTINTDSTLVQSHVSKIFLTK